MKYIQNQIEFDFKLNPEQTEWFTRVKYFNGIEIDFSVEKKMFEIELYDKRKFDWEYMQVFTEHVMRNIDYLTSKSRMWIKQLYDGIGNKLNQTNVFEQQGGYFENIIAVELVEINRYLKNTFYYEVTPFYDSKTGVDMDFDFYTRFRHIAIDNACFEGVMKR